MQTSERYSPAFLARLFAAFLLSWLFIASTTGEAAEVDLEIVLAVDASGSVDKTELQLQLGGIAAAFRDKTVQRAIIQGPNQKIAVSMLIWSDAAFAKFPTDWHILESSQTAEAFASVVETFRETTAGVTAIGGGGTGLGDGLAFALGMIESNGINAHRRIVDISGDGIETPPWNEGAIILPQARNMAKNSKVTVNGLAITTDNDDLTDWYRKHVAIGPGNFVLSANSYHDFKRAIREKLLREFSAPAIGLNNLENYPVRAHDWQIKTIRM